MPFGLWKSKWEIHREDMERQREASDRRSAEHRAEMERQREKTEDFFAEMREERARSDERWARSDERWQQIGDEGRESRARYEKELAETRKATQKVFARMDRNERNIEAATKMLGEQTMGMRKDLRELKEAIDAQTQAIFTLVDRFEDPGGRSAA